MKSWIAPVLWLGCLSAATGCGHSEKAPDEVQGWLRDLASMEPEVRVEAAAALGRRGERAAVQPLVKCLGDIRPDVRRAAAEALGQIGDPASVQPLGAVVCNVGADGQLRRLAAGALGRIAHPSGAPALAEALRSQDQGLVHAAAYGLGRIGDEGANAALVEALRRGSPHARRAAAAVLGHFAGKDSVERMRELLSDSGADIRLSAAESLARLGDAQAIPAIVDLLMDPNETVRLGVRPLVMRFGEKAFVSLERILRLPGKTVERVGPDGQKTRVDVSFAREVARRLALRLDGPKAVVPLLLVVAGDAQSGGREAQENERRLLGLLSDVECRAALRGAIEADEGGCAAVGLALLADHFVRLLPTGAAPEEHLVPEEGNIPDREACRELGARLRGGAAEARFHAARLLCALGDARARDTLLREFTAAIEAIRKAWAEYETSNPYPTKAPEGRKDKEGNPLTLAAVQRTWWHFRSGVAKLEIARARAVVEALFGVADKSLADGLLPVLKIGDSRSNYAWDSVLAAVARILEKVRDPSYVEPLLAVMESGRGDYLADVARALGAFGDPRGFEPIERHIARIGPNDQYMIRKRLKCYHGLYGCDRERAARAVGDVLKTSSAHQYEALQQTVGLVAQYPSAGAAPGLVHWLDHDIKHVQETVRAALVRVAKGHIEWLIENFEVESHTKRSALAGLIADEFGAAGVPELARAAHAPNSRLRQGATWALACIGGPEAVEVVRERLKDEYPAVRSAAAWGAGRLGNRELASDLVALLADADPVPRSMAAEQLGVLGDTSSVQPLIRVLGDADAKVRGYAALSLAKLGAPEALDAVTVLLGDKDQDVKTAAEYTVKVLTDAKARTREGAK